jgi:S-adenosylmethionine:tRNA ribosyltransferase-isomerase
MNPYELPTYDFALPPELIAAYPASPRDSAKLFVWPQNEERVFRDLPDYFDKGDVLVVNSSKVIPARLFGVRPKRDATAPDVNVEILLHTPRGDFSEWAVFAKPAKRLKENDHIIFAEDFECIVTGREDDQVIVKFPYDGAMTQAKLEAHGHVPLPPYIERPDEAVDKTEYQTVYADQSGSIAAPTAGLHFTEELLQKLRDKGVEIVEVTLHVGAGTFLPVTVSDIREHKMHSEWGQVTQDVADAINAAKARGAKITTVGTTATRLIESAARKTGLVEAWEGKTDIFITPGFQFNVADRIVTNFHMPQSTLFMLISAFLGGAASAQALYAAAIAKRYRFYSYGDACLLTRK